MIRAWLVAIGLALAAPAFGHARGGPPAPPAESSRKPPPDTWEALEPRHQRFLERARERWPTMSPEQRAFAIERAERRARWEAMTPEQRDRVRKGMRHYHDLPPELRGRVRDALKVVRQLPEAERRALLERWRALTPEQRRAWLEAGGPGVVPEPKAAPAPAGD